MNVCGFLSIIVHFTNCFYFIFFALVVQCRKRRLKIAVVGVPKTIDNDILLMDKTFGFDTAVEEAQRAINSAYIEVKIHTAPLSSLIIYSIFIKDSVVHSLAVLPYI